MVLARAYETITANLAGTDLQEFYGYLIAEADSHCQLRSFESLKSRYHLNVQVSLGVNEKEYEQTLWKSVKALRNAISHFRYRFDYSSGSSADKALIKVEHTYGDVLMLRMDVCVSDYFHFIGHLGVWIDSALQNNGFLR